MKTLIFLFFASSLLFLSGCNTTPYDYSAFKEHHPKSILVLPPINESNDVNGTYGYFSTATRPIVEQGYYVFPIAVVDRFFQENGLPDAGDMHQAPLDKIDEIFGADAVMYITLSEYGTTYRVLSSDTTVKANAELYDVKTGILLWKGSVFATQGSGDGGGGLIGALVSAAASQIVNQSADLAHQVSAVANVQFQASKTGLLPGPYYPVKE